MDRRREIQRTGRHFRGLARAGGGAPHQRGREVVDVERSRPVAHRRGVQGASGIGKRVAAGGASGAPTATLVTTGPRLARVRVGNDLDRAIGARRGCRSDARPAVARRAAPATRSGSRRAARRPGPPGSSVTINDTAPVTDRWNLAAGRDPGQAGAVDCLCRDPEPHAGGVSDHRERNRDIGPDGHLRVDDAQRVHGREPDGAVLAAGDVHDPGQAARQRGLRRRSDRGESFQVTLL